MKSLMEKRTLWEFVRLPQSREGDVYAGPQRTGMTSPETEEGTRSCGRTEKQLVCSGRGQPLGTHGHQCGQAEYAVMVKTKTTTIIIATSLRAFVRLPGLLLAGRSYDPCEVRILTLV